MEIAWHTVHEHDHRGIGPMWDIAMFHREALYGVWEDTAEKGLRFWGYSDLVDDKPVRDLFRWYVITYTAERHDPVLGLWAPGEEPYTRLVRATDLDPDVIRNFITRCHEDWAVDDLIQDYAPWHPQEELD